MVTPPAGSTVRFGWRLSRQLSFVHCYRRWAGGLRGGRETRGGKGVGAEHVSNQGNGAVFRRLRRGVRDRVVALVGDPEVAPLDILPGVVQQIAAAVGTATGSPITHVPEIRVVNFAGMADASLVQFLAMGGVPAADLVALGGEPAQTDSGDAADPLSPEEKGLVDDAICDWALSTLGQFVTVALPKVPGEPARSAILVNTQGVELLVSALAAQGIDIDTANVEKVILIEELVHCWQLQHESIAEAHRVQVRAWLDEGAPDRATDARLEAFAIKAFLEGHASRIEGMVAPLFVDGPEAEVLEYLKLHSSRDGSGTAALGDGELSSPYVLGNRFCDTVIDYGGRLLDRAFDSASNLPTAAEIANPPLWVARIRGLGGFEAAAL